MLSLKISNFHNTHIVYLRNIKFQIKEYGMGMIIKPFCIYKKNSKKFVQEYQLIHVYHNLIFFVFRQILVSTRLQLLKKGTNHSHSIVHMLDRALYF